MRFDDLLLVSIRQVFRYRRRYWGVVLAIALGVAGFTTMITMGREVKKTMNQDLELIGGVTIVKCFFDNLKASRPYYFHSSTLAALRRLPGVMEVSPVASAWSKGAWRQEKYTFQVMAVDETFWEVRNFWALSGRLFGLQDVNERKRAIVLGARLAQMIFGDRPAVGQILEIENDLFRVIGIVGGITDMDLGYTAFLPLTTFEDRIPKAFHPDRLYVRSLTWDDVDKVAVAIPEVVEAHQATEHLRIEVAWRALSHTRKVAWWIESFVYLAVTATLALGGFGIWNVMMAAVRSRTREIGLKKALGAEDRDILMQFITESLCLSLGAAILGMALGRVMVEGVSLWLGSRPPEALFFSCLGLGLIFAIILGVGAGLYPSVQASRMEVVEATRYE